MFSNSNSQSHNSKLLGYLNFGRKPFQKSRTYKVLPTSKTLYTSASGSCKGSPIGRNVDYLLNKAITKKRYLGVLDPSSPNNKDIFIDSDSEPASSKRRTNNTKLVIEKAISQYPRNIKDFGKYLKESSSSYNNMIRSHPNINIANNISNRYYDNANQRYYDSNIYNDPSISYNNEQDYTYNKPNLKLQNFNQHTYATNDSIMLSELSPNKFTTEERISSPMNEENIYDRRRKPNIKSNKISVVPLNINDFDNQNYDPKDSYGNFYKTNESNFYQTLKNQRKLNTSNSGNFYYENNNRNNRMNTLQPFLKNNRYKDTDYFEQNNYNYYGLINKAASKIQAIWRGGQIREFMSFFYNINKLKYVLMNVIQDHLRDYYKDFIENVSQIEKPKYIKVQITNKDKKKAPKIYTNKTNIIINEKNRNIEKYKSLLSQREKDLENLNNDYNEIVKKYEELLLKNSNNLESNEDKKSQVLSVTTGADNIILGHKNNPSSFSILPEKKEFNEDKITEIQNDCFYILGNILLDKEEDKDDSEKEIKFRRNRKNKKKKIKEEEKIEESVEKEKITNKFNYDEFAKYYISNAHPEKINEITLINNKIEEINKIFDPCILQKCLCNGLDIVITPKKLIFEDNKLFELPQNDINIQITENQKINEKFYPEENEEKEENKKEKNKHLKKRKKQEDKQKVSETYVEKEEEPEVQDDKCEDPVTIKDKQEDIEKKEESELQEEPIKKEKKLKKKKKSKKALNLVLDSHLNNINIIQNGEKKEFNKENLTEENSSFLNICSLPQTETNKVLSSNIGKNNNTTNKEIENEKSENIITKISEICILNIPKENIHSKDNNGKNNIYLDLDSKKPNLNIDSKTSELFVLSDKKITDENKNYENDETNEINAKTDNKNKTNGDNKNETITDNKIYTNKENTNLILETQKSELYFHSKNNSKNSDNPKKSTENLVPNNTESISLSYKNKCYDNQYLSIANKVISLKLNHKKKLKKEKETEITDEFYIIQPSNHYDLIFEGLVKNNVLTQNTNVENKKYNDEENEQMKQDNMEINPIEFKRTNSANIIIDHENKFELLYNKNTKLAEKLKINLIKIILPLRLKSNIRKCISRYIIKVLQNDDE